MAYLEHPFPRRYARGATGGHGHFDTTLDVGTSGHEAAVINWQRARGRWNVSQGTKTDAGYEACRAHFYMARGRAHHWRFRDWADYTVRQGAGRLVAAPGGGYQAFKVYGSGTLEYLRKLTRIAAGTFQAYDIAGAPVSLTVDVETGLVAGTAHTFACEFDVPCRYDTDKFEARHLARTPGGARNYLQWADIDIVEVRE